MKYLVLWLLLVACALVSAYALFAGLVSVWVGVQYTAQDGSWVPVLAGSLCIFAVLFLFLSLSRALFTRRKEMERLDF